MSRLVFLDTETTGLDRERHEVWELAYIVREDGIETESCGLLPVDISRADPTALRLTRFYDRYQNPPPPESAREEAAYFARITSGAHLVGMVPSFDADFLGRWLRSNGYAPAWHYHLVDAEALAAGHLGIGPPWNSEDLSRKVGVEPPDENDRHTALGDARWTMRLYDAVVKAAS